MNYVYLYDPETFEYRGTSIRKLNHVASQAKQEKVYFEVPNSTPVAPPNIEIPNRVLVFSISDNEWQYVEDHRGERVINVETKEMSNYDKLGDVQYPFTLDVPPASHADYLSYIDDSWVLTDRAGLLELVWNYRKALRNRECDKDLEYNGHFYHVDKRSYNDLLLAAQEILLTGDTSITKIWITADSENVELAGTDLINILRAYGERRQRLVYESNQQWKEDEQLSDDELLNLYDELSDAIEVGD